MPTVRLISREEAMKTRTPKEPGKRRIRMNEFDLYVKELSENPAEAVVFEEIEEESQAFVMSLRGAFKRAGMNALVRKMRGRNEVRAWLTEPEPAVKEAEKPKRAPRHRKTAD